VSNGNHEVKIISQLEAMRTLNWMM